MDYHYFLRSRLKFIRQFYLEACAPFLETQRRIDAGEDPYAPERGAEVDEPPFLDEWQDAADALDVLGQTAISMLSTSLQLYLEQWVNEIVTRVGVAPLTDLGIGLPKDDQYKPARERGWINCYRAYCAKLDVDWSSGPTNLELLEDIVLARNTVQHSDDITSMRARSSYAVSKRPSNFFADPLNIAFIEGLGKQVVRPIRLAITEERTLAALNEIEQFCAWLDAQDPLRG